MRLAEGESGVVSVAVNETFDAEAVSEEIKRCRRGELIHYLNGNGVFRVTQCFLDGHDAVILVGRVLREPVGLDALELNVRAVGVENEGRRGDEPVFHGGTVDRNGLNGRSGRSCCLGRTVKTEVDGLFAGAAGQSDYLAGVLIHYDDAALKLRRGAVRCLGQRVKILIDLVDLGLNVLVKAAVDLVACVVYKRLCRKLGDALFGGKVLDYIGDNGLGVVAAHR